MKTRNISISEKVLVHYGVFLTDVSLLRPVLMKCQVSTQPGNSWEDFLWSQSMNISPVSQYERPRAVALASSACVDKTTEIITEFTRKDPFLHLKRAN